MFNFSEEEPLNIKRRVQQKKKLIEHCSFPSTVKAAEVREACLCVFRLLCVLTSSPVTPRNNAATETHRAAADLSFNPELHCFIFSCCLEQNML